MDNFTQPPAERPDETHQAPTEGAAPYQPTGPVNPPTTPYGYPPSYSPGPSAPGQPGYPPMGQPYYPPTDPSAPYGQPGAPSQYGQPGYPSQYGQFGAPAPMSGQYPGYGAQQPPSQYPTPGYPPAVGMAPPWPGPGMPPQGGPRQRRPVWQWIVGIVGGLLILCCVLGVVAAALLHGTATASFVTSNATATVAPTSTPVPTATSAPGVGDHMVLGHTYTRDTAGNFLIVDPSSNFKSSDTFAFVIQLDGPIGTTHATLSLVKVESGGTEKVEETAPMQVSNPNFTEFANKLSTAQLMAGLTPGVYKLEVQTSTANIASAEFTYEG